MTTVERIYRVGVIGFNATERIMLGSVFNLSMRRNPSYRQASAGEAPHLLLVDGANRACIEEAMAATTRQPAAVLLIAEEDMQTGWHFLARPLHWARLFKSMDLALGFLTHGLASRQPGARPAPPRYDLPSELTGAFTVPVKRAPGAAEPGRAGPAAGDGPRPAAAAPALAGDRALYVGSGASADDAIGRALVAAGMAVDIAHTGDRALEIADKFRYRCLFVDVGLTGVDGYQVCRMIKAKPSGGAVPVVLLKHRASAFERIRASMAGCDAFLSTPASDEELRAVAARFLPSARRPAGPRVATSG